MTLDWDKILFGSRRVREEMVEAGQLTVAFIQFALLWGKPKCRLDCLDAKCALHHGSL